MPTHPHKVGVTRILKYSPACQNSYLFYPHYCLTKHINDSWIVNAVFFASQIEIWETAFQNCSQTYQIAKGIPLTFWLMWLSLFFFSLIGFFHWISRVKVLHSAECNMTNILRAFTIGDLQNYSKTWDTSLKYLSILDEATLW